MLDLVDLLNKKGAPEGSKKRSITSVLFHQTAECKNLVNEAYRFEGLESPESLTNSDETISDYVRERDIEIVMIELNKSENISKDAERISHLLPSHASVIIIGCEDAISTIRNLKQMGFYYLYWPVSKEELIDFVKSVNENRQAKRGLGQGRKAKRVAIVGTKGGVGTTLIAAEVSHLLTGVKKASCVLVDHNYFDSNMDIMLGVSKFQRYKIQAGNGLNSLDISSAKALLHREDDKLSVLSLTSEEFGQGEVREHTRNVVDVLAEDVNFIVEDYSTSAMDLHSSDTSWLDGDCLIVVLSRFVASVRETAQIVKRYNSLAPENRPRLILVVNNTLPEKYVSLEMKQIQAFLKLTPQVEIPFIGDASKELLKGNWLSDKKGCKAYQPLHHLSSLIIGEDVNAKKSPKLFSLLGKK